MLKALQYTAVISICLIFTGCTSEIPKSKTYVQAGLVYEIGKQSPFTGIVYGKRKEGYRRKPLQYKKEYKNGQLSGETRFWYANGKIESIEPYHNNQINGMVARYYENGQIKSYIHMVNGMRGGHKGEQFWSEDGKRIR